MRLGILVVVTGTLRQYIRPIGSYSAPKQLMNKYWYPFITRRWTKDDVVFLNWGYEEDPPLGLPLTAEDEPNRYCIELYPRFTAAQADLSGKQVLEVSCGHGGGAAYVVPTFHPGSYTGLDFNPDGIAFGQKRHDLPGLDFVHGDAREDCPSPMSPSTRCSTSKPRMPTRILTVFSAKLLGCCGQEGISFTPISVDTSNTTLGMQHWPTCRCG